MTRIDIACYERGCACHDDRVDGETVEVVQRTWQGLTDEHPLVVFAKECVLGAYKESELGDAARRAIERAHGIKE